MYGLDVDRTILIFPVAALMLATIPDKGIYPKCLTQNSPTSLFKKWGCFDFIPGGDLLSHTVTRAVPSALRGLTSVFGMGTGVTPSA